MVNQFNSYYKTQYLLMQNHFHIKEKIKTSYFTLKCYFLSIWELFTKLIIYKTFREIWEIQKDAFIRRYQKLNPQNSSFDADIAR